MLKRLANKLTMYQAVQNVLKQNKTVWETVPAMVEVFATYDALLERIESYKRITGINKKGITMLKAKQQEEVITHVYEVASALYVLATRTNNAVLAGKVNYTRTDLVKTRDTGLVVRCMAIADLATEHLDDLEAYQVTEDEIRSLKEEIDRFSDNLPTTRISVSERKAANERMKAVFVEVDAILKNQIDRLMVRYEKSQPEFYFMYQNLRRIINYGVRHQKAKEAENTAQGLNI